MRYGPPQHWHCRCGAAYPISGAELAAAFPDAAGEAKPDRVVWLPLSGRRC
ncbi:MAG: hypothetical protein ACRDRG_00770 [Pseudonocardiaceae bacterium]